MAARGISDGGYEARRTPKYWRASISFRGQWALLTGILGAIALWKWEGRMFKLLRWLFRRRQPRVTHMQWIVAENVKATSNLRGNRLHQ